MTITPTTRSERITRGREIRAHLQTFPLRQEPGKYQDFVFYCIPPSDTYGAHSRSFFRTYYPFHRKFNVTSLEHIFRELERAVARTSASFRIREIVIVAHSNSWGVDLPLTHKDHLAKLRGDEYAPLYPETIAALQPKIARDHPEFQRARTHVLPHLDDASWITMRSCNFGYAREGMYALYAIFGGHANVYALQAFMTFADIQIGPGLRLATREQAYDYVRKQGLIDRSPTASKARLRALLERLSQRNGGRLPIQFFIPDEYMYDLYEGFQLLIASKPDPEGSPRSPVPYDTLISHLDAGKADAIRKIITGVSEDYALDAGARVSRFRSNQWRLTGRFRGRARRFLVKQRPSLEQDGSIHQHLKLYEPVDERQKLSADPPWVRCGVPYDVPGVELQAQLDRYSIDDLVCLQEQIRSAYEARNVILIEHAQRSITRRPEVGAWFMGTPCGRKMINDPLYPADEESCYWSPPSGLRTGLKDDEKEHLEEYAHTDHNGLQLWVDVKANQAPDARFDRDLFAQSLPFAPSVPDSYPESDVASVDANMVDPAPVRGRPRTPATDIKEDPLAGRPTDPPPPTANVFRSLNNKELRLALEEAITELRRDPAAFSARLQGAIEDVDLAIGQIFAVTEEIAAWAPASFVGRFVAAGRWFFAANLFYVAVFSPFLGWFLITVESHRVNEAHRIWGIRAGLNRSAGALFILSYRLRRGESIQELTTTALVDVANTNRSLDLRQYVPVAIEALKADLSMENWRYIRGNYLEGYDLAVSESSKFATRLLREVNSLIRQDLAAIGLDTQQTNIVMRSGVINTGNVYAALFEGLANLLFEELKRFPND